MATEPPPPTGIITVDKVVANPDGPQISFQFTSTAWSGTHLLADGEEYNATSLATSGDGLLYVVTELDPAPGYLLSAIACDDGTTVGSTDVPNRTATILLDPGEHVTCTFTNTQQVGTIIITKLTDPATSAVFDFTGDLDTSLLAGASIVYHKAPGTYSIAETPNAAFALTEISCQDPTTDTTTDLANRSATIAVVANETVQCLFVNTELGLVVIQKLAEPEAVPSLFAFSGDLTAPVPGGGSASYYLVPGNYTAIEDPRADYVLVNIQCDDAYGHYPAPDSTGDTANRTAHVRLQAGETVSCLFHNVRLPEIVVEKRTDPSGSDVNAHFSILGLPGDPIILADGQNASRLVPEPGTYVVEEEPTPDDYILTDIECDSGDPVVDLAEHKVTVHVDMAQSVRCVFTNTELGELTIVKVTDPPEVEGSSFFFYGTVQQYLAHNQSASTSHLMPGLIYGEAEWDPTPYYDLTDITCTERDSQVDYSVDLENRVVYVDMQPGQDVVCTFTDTKRGTVIVEKTTVPSDASTRFNFTSDFSDPFNLTDGGSREFDLVPAGPHSLTEAVTPGYDVTDVRYAPCDEQEEYDGPGQSYGSETHFTLLPGATLYICVENSHRGRIEVEKQVDPDRSPLLFDFTSDVGAPFTLRDNQTHTILDVPVGEHWVRELIPEGDPDFDLLSIECTSPDYAGNNETEPAKVFVQVHANETIHCTFYNRERGHIVIEKRTVPAGVELSFPQFEGFEDFPFHVEADSSPFTQDFVGGNGIESGQRKSIDHLVPDWYRVSEVLGDIPPIWDFTSLSCTSSRGSLDNESSDPAAIWVSVRPGETVTCVYVNTERATLIVDKVAPQFEEAEFGFLLLGNHTEQEFSLAPGGSHDPFYLVAGTYNLTESPGEWALKALCTGGPFGAGIKEYTNGADLKLKPGDVVHCRFYNYFAQEGSADLRVVKTIVNDDGGTLAIREVKLRIDGTMVANGTTTLLPRGFHWVSEALVDGYAWTFSGACDVFGVVFLQPVEVEALADGNAMECDITNDDIRPEVILYKHVRNEAGGTLQATDFQFVVTVNGDTENATYQTGEEDGDHVFVPTGRYRVTERLTDGGGPVSDAGYFAIVGPGCSGMLRPGAIVTCIITNVDHRVGGGGGGGGDIGTEPPGGNGEPGGGPLTEPGSGAPDSDGDGIPDAIEALACSDPLNATSVPDFDLDLITIETLPDGSLLISWPDTPCTPAGFIVWSSHSPWVIVAVVGPDQHQFVVSAPVDGTKYKVSWFTGQAPAQGYATDPGTIPGWQGEEYSTYQAPPQAVAPTPPPASAPAAGGGASGWILGGALVLLAAVALAVLTLRRGAPPGSGPGEPPMDPLSRTEKDEDRVEWEGGEGRADATLANAAPPASDAPAADLGGLDRIQ